MHDVDPTRIMFSGSRDLRGVRELIAKVLDNYVPGVDIIIVGDARGVDAEVKNLASSRGFRVVVYPAEWKKYGRAAGPIRNAQMVEACDVGYCIWDGRSRGTKNSLSLLTKSGKLGEVFVIDQSFDSP